MEIVFWVVVIIIALAIVYVCALSTRKSRLGRSVAPPDSKEHGISSDRIRFLGSTPRDEHLAAYNQVDISLDPFPQNGGVSTWEALQMGVPVVAKLGATVSSRISGAILFSVGMSDWVAEGADGYVSIAVKNAAQIEQLAKFRRELAAGTMVSSVIEGASYTRTVEAAYRHMWRTYCHSRSQ